jgi:DNA invertase Pin-like site-specific DNA recombinase
MSLVADMLFKAPPPAFKGQRRVNRMDDRRPDGSLRPGQANILNRQLAAASNEAVLKSIRLGIGRIYKIAEDTGLSVSTVKRALNDLKDDGQIDFSIGAAGAYFYREVK